MLTFSDFILFLYEEKCLVNYFDNIKDECTYGEKKDFKDSVKRIMGFTPSNFVLSAFDWDLSQEGPYFWANVYIKWRSLISNER